ncbi:MAG: hypothetical protein MJ161_07100 [Clostridia bacterium]|nr:hypothetical protein [Clostridia bacterium]
MKVLKFIVAVILALNLLAATGLALGSVATEKAISDDAIEKAITKTGAVEELTDRIISQRTVNMGGQYGKTMQTILKSDAMTDFFTEYTARALQAQVYGTECEEIGSDDLNRAFSRGIDECIDKGSISMGSEERLIFDEALNTAMPILTEGINYVLAQMNLTSFVDGNTTGYLEKAQLLTSAKVQYGSMAIAVVLCIILIILFGGSMTGFVWDGVCILLVAAFFFIMSMMLEGTMEASAAEVALSTRMMYVMTGEGLAFAGTAGGIAGAAFIVIRGIIRAIIKR